MADTVLVAARAAGLNIPSGCNFGVCGTCKIQKLAGEVNMVHNGGISVDDIEGGFIFACCARRTRRGGGLTSVPVRSARGPAEMRRGSSPPLPGTP